VDFSGLPVWMQDLIPLMTWATLAGVFFLTIWTIIAKIIKTLRKDKSGFD